MDELPLPSHVSSLWRSSSSASRHAYMQVARNLMFFFCGAPVPLTLAAAKGWFLRHCSCLRRPSGIRSFCLCSVESWRKWIANYPPEGRHSDWNYLCIIIFLLQAFLVYSFYSMVEYVLVGYMLAVIMYILCLEHNRRMYLKFIW